MPEPASNPEQEAWDELKRLAEKHRLAEDVDIAKALEGVLVSKAQSLALSAKKKPGWVVEFPLLEAVFSALPSDQADLTDQTDLSNVPNDLEAAERFIREAHIASMRGDKAKARELLEQAEKAAPTSGTVLAALGDAALERHNVKEAVRLFALAKKADPTNVAIEKKHADAAFRLSQGMIFDPTARPGSDNVAGAKAAVVMSTMFPGLGQIVSGEVIKGLSFMAIWMGGLVWIIFVGFEGLAGMIGLKQTAKADATGLVPIAMIAIGWLLSVFDASSKAKHMEKRKINRPKPPSDLPFE